MMVDVKQSSRSSRSRGAITVIEVLFAMLVAVVGLLGIASVLPLAARNARESNGYNFVHSAGTSWYQEFSARGLNDYSGWRALQDYQVGSTNPQFVTLSHTAAITPTNSTVTSLPVNRMWAHQAICIDPYFYTDPTVSSEITSAIGAATVPFPANHQALRPAVFPYYQDGHNPVTDVLAPASPWPDQPRMIRVTLDAPMSTMPLPLRQVPREYAQMLFTANDDFASFVDEQQNEIPATRLFSSVATTGPTSFSKAISERKYSWLATLSPREPTSVTPATATQLQHDYSLSIAIFQARDMSWVDSTDATSLTPGLTDNKPSGERLVWVYPLSGDFIGGNGGRVRLITNSTVDDRLTIGDWMMLGKHYVADPSAPLNRFAYFRWYRIVAVDAEPQRGRLDKDEDSDSVGDIVDSGTDFFGAAGAAEVWSRDVVLEGPDWAFGGAYPTTGTLMKNVITVIDRSTIIP